ncbi:MAG: putative histidine protein kinase [Chloroflexi bacterium]|nr:putative histidine protein kinase [Chloroflexota bacterium]
MPMAAALAAFSRCALTAEGLAEVIEEAVRLATRTLEADGAAVIELAGDGGGATLRAGVGLPSGTFGTEDLTSDEFWRRGGMDSRISGLVRAGGRTWGVLSVFSRSQRSFTWREALAVETIANVLAMAVQRKDLEICFGRSEAELDRRIAEERRRAAEDIHDEALQTLAGAILLVDHLGMVLSTPDEEGLLGAVEDALQTAVRQLRSLIGGLRPPSLEPGRLMAAIREAAERTFANQDVRVSVVGELRREPESSARTVIFKIAQEALANCRKHAGATRIEVGVAEVDGGIEVGIRDNGMGFNALEISDSAAGGHMGMSSMRERAERAGGRWSIESRPGCGTVVAYWIPIDVTRARSVVVL